MTPAPMRAQAPDRRRAGAGAVRVQRSRGGARTCARRGRRARIGTSAQSGCTRPVSTPPPARAQPPSERRPAPARAGSHRGARRARAHSGSLLNKRPRQQIVRAPSPSAAQPAPTRSGRRAAGRARWRARRSRDRWPAAGRAALASCGSRRTRGAPPACARRWARARRRDPGRARPGRPWRRSRRRWRRGGARRRRRRARLSSRARARAARGRTPAAASRRRRC